MYKPVWPYMNRGRIVFVTALTFVMVVTLTFFVGHTITDVNYRIRQSCFDELADATKQLAVELYRSISSDHTTLSAIATIIANQETLTDEGMLKILNAYNFDTSYISHLQVLKPDGTMLYADGEVRDVSAFFNFAKEAQGGKYISHVQQSIRNPEASVVRHIVPIKRDGEVVYILYGTVTLAELSDNFTTQLYDGKCYVYIVDADNGDFILNTWHKKQSNIINLGERQIIDGGKSIAETIEDMRNGVSGETGFISRTTGNILYMRYTPIGINKLCAMITVEEKYAFAKNKDISRILYTMAAVIGAMLLAYVVCVVGCMYLAYRHVRTLGTEDQGTGLLNRNMYLLYLEETQNMVFDMITCVYVDVNGLHQMNNEKGHEAGDQLLSHVAVALLGVFDYHALYRIGGDEFVAFSKTDDEYACAEKMKRITEKLGEKGYSISFGIVSRQAESGLKRITKEADNAMLKNKSAYYLQHNRRN